MVAETAFKSVSQGYGPCKLSHTILCGLKLIENIRAILAYAHMHLKRTFGIALPLKEFCAILSTMQAYPPSLSSSIVFKVGGSLGTCILLCRLKDDCFKLSKLPTRLKVLVLRFPKPYVD